MTKIQLPHDLDALQLRGDLWGMSFNASKCNIMSLSSTENPLVKFYELSGTVLQHFDCATYLGIALHKFLKFGPHIQSIASKCNQHLGFLKRNLKKCPQSLRQMVYLSIVCSCAEYGASIWDPHLKKDILTLEKVQN